MSVDAATGGGVVDMGIRGKMTYSMDPDTQVMHMKFSMVTLPGLADMLTQLFTLIAGDGAAGRQIVDMTGIQGNYQAELDFSLEDMMNMARSTGMVVNAAAGNSSHGASTASVTDAVESLGLKLEPRKAIVEQLTVVSAERTPTAN